MKSRIPFFAVLLLVIPILWGCNEQSSQPESPNVIIILTDDQGWDDAGFNGCTDIHTPHLDAMAGTGVIFSQGYVSHPYCSPSRAGLLTGRYQQHFGHESNPGYDGYETDNPPGLPLNETLLPELLKKSGYITGAIGKWHLGNHPQFWPINRGFDYWYGFSGGGRGYWPDENPNSQKQLLLNGEPVGEDSIHYLTNTFTEEAVGFITKNKEKPFFLYLAYNAPHGPIHATAEYLRETDYIEEGGRSAYAAMVVGIDRGVGKIREALVSSGIIDNTLVIFLSDNGGADNLGASNLPYRGRKGMLFEGGIRVPFFMTWPEVVEPGMTYPHPVISLDLFPTILAATGTDLPGEIELDGVNLLPFMAQSAEPVHKTLYWRYSDGMGWAVRHGKYKLVNQHMKPLSLFDMEKDPLEQYNLSSELPDITATLQTLYEQWNQQNVEPLWDDPHIENVEKQENERKAIINRASNGEN